MNRILITIFALLIASVGHTQGINFETGTWAEVVAKAKAQNKLIYVDVFTTWCGPCKAMAKNIFPNEEVGKKYNELFINYKTDAEKEGKAVAAQYGVSAYPTNLYINPHNEQVVYRIAGGCGVEEFLARGDRALEDFKDPLSWEQYNAELLKKDVSKQFVLKYIEKARRIGQHHDKALDVYMDKFITEPVSNDELAFLVTNTLTYDNKAFPYLQKNVTRVNEIFKDRPQFFQNHIRTALFQGTFKKAIDLKDVKVLETAKPIINEYSSTNAEGAWLGFLARFYETIGQKEELYKALKQAANNYAKVKMADYGKRNIEMLEEHKKNMREELRSNGVPEEKIPTEIEQILKTKPDLAQSFSANAINTYNAAIQYFIKNKVNDNKKLTEAYQWSKNLSQLTANDVSLYPNAMKQQAWIEYQLGKKTEATNSIQKAIDFLKANNKPTQAFDNDILLIKEGKFDINIK